MSCTCGFSKQEFHGNEVHFQSLAPSTPNVSVRVIPLSSSTGD